MGSRRRSAVASARSRPLLTRPAPPRRPAGQRAGRRPAPRRSPRAEQVPHAAELAGATPRAGPARGAAAPRPAAHRTARARHARHSSSCNFCRSSCRCAAPLRTSTPAEAAASARCHMAGLQVAPRTLQVPPLHHESPAQHKRAPPVQAPKPACYPTATHRALSYQVLARFVAAHT